MERLENVRGSTESAYRIGGPDVKPTRKARKAQNRLDSEEMRRRHAQLMDWYGQERDRQSVNRYQMAVDEDYYDGLQIDEETEIELNDRDQAPLVFNKVMPAMNWVTGTQKKTRMDYKILPREEADETMAEVKTKLFKYVSDANHAPFAVSDAFADAVIAGIGWLEEGVNTEPGAELVFAGSESWRNVLHDSLCTKRDLNDGGRYQYRWKWLDLDIGISLFPARAGILQSAAMDADEIAEKDEDIWYMGARASTEEADFARTRRHTSSAATGQSYNSRQRVKIIEGWYKVPVQVQVMRGGGKFDGEIYDDKNPEHNDAVTQEFVSLSSTTYMQMRVMLMTETHVLYESESPYRHNRFPLTPIWCYRRRRDNMPYGMIRNIRDSQDDYNKRASKALFILSTNQIVMDKEAVDAKDVEKLRDEAARPDGIIVHKKGTKLEFRQDKQLAEEHLGLMDRDARMIQDISGITDENMGRETNASSGIALGKRQDQGHVVTYGVFDNMRYALQLAGELRLSNIEQFMTAEKVVRIVGENKPIEWLPVNKVDPMTGEMLNNVTASKADFIISEQDYRASLREAMFEQLMDMLGKIAPVMPQAAMNLLDLVIELADIPNRAEFVSRIRKINGQTDPTKKPTPEEIGRQQEIEGMAKEQAMLTMDKLRAEVANIKGKTGQMSAQQFATFVEGLYASLQAAQIVSTVPNVTPVADVIAKASGFTPQGGVDPDIPQPQGALPSMTPQSKHGDYIGSPAPAQAGVSVSGAQPEQALQGDGAQAGIETPANDGVTQ